MYRTFSIKGSTTKTQSVTEVLDALEENGFRSNEEVFVENNVKISVYPANKARFNEALSILMCFKFYFLECLIS